MGTLIKELEAGLTLEQISTLLRQQPDDLLRISDSLTLEQIGATLQQQTNDILYICGNKLYNVGIFDDMYDHFSDDGQEYELIANDEKVPSWTVRQKNPTAYARYNRYYNNKSYTFFDKDTMDCLLDKGDGGEDSEGE